MDAYIASDKEVNEDLAYWRGRWDLLEHISGIIGDAYENGETVPLELLDIVALIEKFTEQAIETGNPYVSKDLSALGDVLGYMVINDKKFVYFYCDW